MKIHLIKIHPENFKLVVDNLKPYEIRFNDRDYKVLDSLIMQEYYPDSGTYTGFEIRCDISHIFKNDSMLQENFVILTICNIKFYKDKKEIFYVKAL